MQNHIKTPLILHCYTCRAVVMTPLPVFHWHGATMQTLPTKIFTSLAMDMVALLDQRKQDMDDNFNDNKSQITWNQYIPDGALEFNWGNKRCVTVLNVHTFLWSSQAVKLIMSCLDFHAIAWLCICACCIVTTYRNTFLYYCRLQISTEGIYHGKEHSVHPSSKEEWPACFCASSVHLCEALCMLKCIVVICHEVTCPPK